MILCKSLRLLAVGLLPAAVVGQAAALFQAQQACRAGRLCSEVKQVQIGTLALVQLGDPPPGQRWRHVHVHVSMLLHNRAVDHENIFSAPTSMAAVSIWYAEAHLSE